MKSWGIERTFDLPKKLEAFLAILFRRYKEQNNETLLKIVVNAKPQVDEAVAHDNWDGGEYGHRVRLPVPGQLFHEVMNTRGELEIALYKDLNMLADVPHESFAEVLISLQEEVVPADWREKSGALLSSRPSLEKTSESDEDRLWSTGHPHIFLSHRAQHKKLATALKNELRNLGAAAFVAHVDIEPTKEWQAEIERALGSMDVLVALLTEGFRSSYWANQEVGVAIGRGIPVLSFRLDEDPVGFIGKYQALAGNEEQPREMADNLLARLIETGAGGPLLLTGLVQGWEKTGCWRDGNRLMRLLGRLPSLTPELLARLEAAFTRNDQLHTSPFTNREFPIFVAHMRAASNPVANKEADSG